MLGSGPTTTTAFGAAFGAGGAGAPKRLPAEAAAGAPASCVPAFAVYLAGAMMNLHLHLQMLLLLTSDAFWRLHVLPC